MNATQRRWTYVLAGQRLGVERLVELPRLIASAGSLLGPGACHVRRRARRGEARSAEARWAQRAAARLDVSLSIHGLDHIDPGTTYVVAPLHEGFADALALLHLPLRLRFVARDELREWKVLGAALSTGGHPVVRPERPVTAYRRLLRTVPDILETGDSVVVFPQGSILGIETAFGPGAFRLAATTGHPLLPIVLTGSHRVWEHPFSPIVRFGQRIRLEVLPAVDPDAAVGAMRSLQRTMKQIALSSDPAPRRYVPERDGWWDGYRFEIDPGFPELARRVADHRSAVRAA